MAWRDSKNGQLPRRQQVLEILRSEIMTGATSRASA